MDKSYSPENFEKDTYAFWKSNGFFKATVNPNKKKFSIVMPPPNVTGQLHIGHALNNTIQDILVRYKRMKGFEACWIPGTDHAAIATEAKVVDKLVACGKTKEDIGREEFIKEGWDWYKKFGNRICEQLQALGVSPDWDRLAFTMDENLSNAVKHAFVHYYKKGLVYRGKRVVNWCPHCKSAISDTENIYEEKNTFIWHIRYPFEDGSGEVVVATTRPETMFGDTAVAVNPNDKRYFGLVGKNLCLPLTDRKIPLIADDYCEIGFGTGAVKITPAHDPNDYEVGCRHNLEIISCIDDCGNLMENTGEFAGLDREVAREKVVKKLEETGFLVKKEKYKHSVGTCQRCHTITEPKISTQWWVKMEELAKPAIEAVKNGDLKFIPKRFEKQYLNWLLDIRDWCVSRQLWLGHRIPAYYCECGEMVVSEQEVKVCPKCGKPMTQDSDVLDTWFSSALWPFSTLGYPNKTPDLDYFYPTDTLVTAYDIISFWVTKMVFSGLEFMDKVPFSEVVINGIVRDIKGRKMSKSLGNGIDPLELIDKYGADSLRYSLIYGMSMGIDTKFDSEKTAQAKLFINKLYNASKFVILNTKDVDFNTYDFIIEHKNELSFGEKWILSNLNKLSKEVNKNLDKHEQGIALGKITTFIWNKFCDWFIEYSKPNLQKEDNKLVKAVLLYTLDASLKLIHPFIPFVTEYIYQDLPIHEKTIMLQPYPEFNSKLNFKCEDFERILELVKNIRNIRAENKIADNFKINLFVNTQDKAITESACEIQKLTMSNEICFTNKEPANCIKCVINETIVYVEKQNDADSKERLKKDLEKVEFEILRSEKMLSNVGFTAKAPQSLIDAEKEKLEKNKSLKEKILSELNN